MLPLEYHEGLIRDGTRMAAFAEAIRRTVRPGDAVVDLGTGTGILAVLAARAGARVVYAVEEGPIAPLAEALARENGVGDVVRVIAGRSTQVDLPERVDVLVTETIGSLGPDERIRTWVADARARWLRQGARIVPAALDLWLAPARWPALDEPFPAMDVALDSVAEALRCTPRSPPLVRFQSTGGVVGVRAFGGHVDFSGPLDGTVRIEATFGDAPGIDVANAIVGGFRAELAPGVRLDRDPAEPSNWPLRVFPLDRPHPARGMHAWIEHSDALGHVWGARSEAGVESHAEALASAQVLRAASRRG